MTSEWAHLPNAEHIDWVLSSLRTSHGTWGAAMDAARGAAMDAARGAARGAAMDEAWGAARGAAWDALLALIAWDDSGDVLDMPVAAVRLLCTCGDHRATLLMPACMVKEELLTLKELP